MYGQFFEDLEGRRLLSANPLGASAPAGHGPPVSVSLHHNGVLMIKLSRNSVVSASNLLALVAGSNGTTNVTLGGKTLGTVTGTIQSVVVNLRGAAAPAPTSINIGSVPGGLTIIGSNSGSHRNSASDNTDDDKDTDTGTDTDTDTDTDTEKDTDTDTDSGSGNTSDDDTGTDTDTGSGHGTNTNRDTDTEDLRD